MYHVNAQGADERIINVHYYYYYKFERCDGHRIFEAKRVTHTIITMSFEYTTFTTYVRACGPVCKRYRSGEINYVCGYISYICLLRRLKRWLF